MNIVCIGGGPSGLYFALLMKKQNPAHDVTVVERNKPYDTFGWGVVFSDQTLGNLQAADAPTAAEILGAFNHWDDIEVNIRGQQDPLRRPRLLRHRPQAPAQHPAEALRGPRRQAGVRDRREGRRGVPGRRPHHRQRRPEQPHPRASTPPPTSPTSTCAIAASSGWARTRNSTPSPSPSRRPSTAGSRPMPTSSTARPPPSSSRRREEVWQKAGLDKMEKEESIAFCEKLFAKYLDGQHADVQRLAPARLGAVDQVSARGLPHLGAPQRPRAGGADGRCGPHRAFLGRLRHQARAGGCDRAGALHRRVAARTWRRRCATTRPCAASKC